MEAHGDGHTPPETLQDVGAMVPRAGLAPFLFSEAHPLF